MPDAAPQRSRQEPPSRRVHRATPDLPFTYAVTPGIDPEDGSDTCVVRIFGVEAGGSLDAARSVRRAIRNAGEVRPLVIEVVDELPDPLPV